jgi:hypothetical protein
MFLPVAVLMGVATTKTICQPIALWKCSKLPSRIASRWSSPVLLEADTIVQNIGLMKKPKRDEAFVNTYVSKINNIACWRPIANEILCAEVLCSYKVVKKQNQ